MEHASSKKSTKARRQVAACSYLLEKQAEHSDVAKLWLEKIDGNWKAIQAIDPEELFRAHPIKPPRDRPPYIFSPLAALRFEEKIYQRHGGFRRIREPSHFPCGGGQREGQLGWCEIEYGVSLADRALDSGGDKQCEVVTYLFEQNAQGSWEISRTLGSEQKFNRKSQKVEPRERVPEHCG